MHYDNFFDKETYELMMLKNQINMMIISKRLRAQYSDVMDNKEYY